MSENPLPGDIVQIKGKSKLISILRQFSPTMKCLSPFDIEDVNEAFATLLEIEDRDFIMNGQELKVFKLMLENGSDIVLPESAFDIVERGNVGDDLGATLTIPSNFEDEITDRRRAEELMIHHMAAESIQVAFRRYRECKAAIKMKKVTSSQRLVENLAAETITKNLKKVVSKNKLQRGSSNRSIHSQQSTESLRSGVNVEAPHSSAGLSARQHSSDIPPLHAPSSTPQRPPQPAVSKPLDSKRDAAAAPTAAVSAPESAAVASAGIAGTFVSPIRTSTSVTTATDSVKEVNQVSLPNLDGKETVLHLTSMKATNLGNACWQGVNDVYLVVGAVVYEPSSSSSSKSSSQKVRRSWKYRTETLYEAGATADYPGQDLNIPIQTESEVESDAVLQVEAYHQGLAIEDKLIGASADLSLTRLLGTPSTAHFPQEAFDGRTRSVDVELFEGVGAKRKSRGCVQLTFTLQRGLASTGLGVSVTAPSLLPDAVSITSGSIGVLEFVKKQTSDKAMSKSGGGMSAASLHAAMNTLNASEGKASSSAAVAASASGKRKETRPASATAPAARSNVRRESQTKQSSADDSKPPRTAVEPHSQSTSQTQKQQQQQPQRRTVSSETSTKARSADRAIPTSVMASSSYDENGSYLTGPTNQSSNVSYTSEGQNSEFGGSTNRRAAGSSANAMRLSVSSQRTSGRGSGVAMGTAKLTTPEPQEAIPPTQSSLVPPADFRAVDEAFRLAFKQECAVVKLTVKELTLVLDALGYKVHSTDHMSGGGGGIAAGGSNFSSSQYSGGLKFSGAAASYSIASASSAGSVNSRAVIDLPILHATSLASTVSNIVRDRALLQHDSTVTGSGFEMSKYKAEVAMNHLATLIEGPFTRIREYILFTCSGELGKSAIRESIGFEKNSSGSAAVTAAEKKYCRPSHWSEQQVGRLLSLLRIPQDSFNGVDGATLLSIDKQFLSQTHDVRASLLRARFAVYQQLLNLLESWWDVGIRPEDFWNESSVKRKNSLKSNERAKSAGKKRPAESVAALDIPALVAANKDQVFEIAEFETLQQQLVSLNRAFGWGIGLDAISLYASGIEKLRGKLVPTSSAAVDVKQNTRMAMKNNQDKLSSKSATASASALLSNPAVGSAGHWIELNLRDSDPAYSSLVSLTSNNRSTFDSLVRFSSEDQTWLAFVPNACLSPSKKSGSNGGGISGRLPQTLQKEDIRLGMFVRITHSEALRRTCERFDWWDRPPPEVLEQMAKSVGEVVSLNELDSKQRVGIKVLQSTVCDAVPIEALIGPCSKEEVQKLLDAATTAVADDVGGNGGEDRPVARSGSNRRGSIKKSTRRKSSVAKPVVKTPPRPPPPTAAAKAEVDPFKQVAESKQRIQRMMKKLKRQYQDDEAALEKITGTVPASTAPSIAANAAAGAPVSPLALARDLPPPQRVPNNWMEAPLELAPQGHGDESGPPPPAAEEEGEGLTNPLRHSDHNPWDGGSPIRADIRADYSWLRPVPPVDKTKSMDMFKKKTTPAGAREPATADVGAGLVVEDIVTDPLALSPRAQHQQQPQPQGVSAVHITQATFDAAHAQYRDGGRAPPSPSEVATAGVDMTPERVRTAGMRGMRPKSATGHPQRRGNAATASAVNEMDALSSPKFGTDSAPFGVSGFGYTPKGRAANYRNDLNNKWVSENTAAADKGIQAAAAAVNDEGEGKSSPSAHTKKNKSHLERNKETLAKYFEYSARANVEEGVVAGGGDPHFLFNPPSPEANSPPKVVRGKAEKVSARPTSAPAAKNRGVSNRYTANLKLNSSLEKDGEEDMDRVKPRPLSEYIAEEAADTAAAAASAGEKPNSKAVEAVTPERPKTTVNAKRKTKSPREEVLKHRESARSQKEAEYKENSLLRELKKLGVKDANPW